MTLDTAYALELSRDEIERYRHMAATARREEARLWAAAGIAPGARVADLGCGPAAVTLELAAVVGPDGWVDGVDSDPAAVEAARAALAAARVTSAAIALGDAAASGLAEGAYDVVMLRHVLAHNGRAAPRILAHAASLLRPGGHLFAVDTDLTAGRLVPGDADLVDEARRHVELLGGSGGDVAIGPRLAHLLIECGLDVVHFGGMYSVVWAAQLAGFGPPRAARRALLAAGLATADDARRWDAAGERYLADPRGKYLVAPMFHVIGRRGGPEREGP